MNILTITGASCSGKDKLLEVLTEQYNFGTVPTYTTRPARVSDDRSRIMSISPMTFDMIIENDGFIEWAEFGGYRYGAPKDELSKCVQNGLMPVKILEPVGLSNMVDYCEASGIEVVRVLLHADEKTLVRRWLARANAAKEYELDDMTDRILNTIHVEKNWRKTVQHDIAIDTDLMSPQHAAYAIYRVCRDRGMVK